MPPTKQPTARQGRASGGTPRQRNSGSSKPAARSRGRAAGSSSARRSSGNGARRSSGSRPRAAARNRSSRPANSNGTLGSAVVPVASAAVGTAAGVVGGALLGRRLRPRRKVLGIPVPGTRGGFDGLAGQVGKAAKELGR